MRIRFANWQPDLQGLTNPGQDDIKNVYPTGGGGYGPIKALAEISTTALDKQCLGAYSAQDSGGVTNTFAGTSDKLEKLSAAVWSDVSKGGGYSVGATERWEFAQYGQRVIATQIGDVPQYFTMNSSSLFANLGGSPPQARHIAVVRDFVVLGNTGNDPGEVYWSGFNNSDQWTIGTNQCDSQILQGGGWVQAITGGAVGTIFQESAIVRMTYVGPPLIFQFDTVQDAPGLSAPGALVKVGDIHYYYAQSGFHSYDYSNGYQNIGNSKVDNWFASHIAGNTLPQITAGVDMANKLVYWSFVSTDATDTSHPDTVIIYNWLTKEFSYAKFAHEMIFRGLSEGLTLEQLSAIYPVLENVPESLDSRTWTGGSQYLAAFDTSHQLCSFSGSNLAAALETSDQELSPGKRAFITNVHLFSDAASATCTVRSRGRFASALVDVPADAMQSNGDFPCEVSGRYHRIHIDIPAATTWTFATGLEIDSQDDGEQ